MIRKNDTLIFFKAYDVFFQNQVSFCFYQKKKHEITNEPTLTMHIWRSDFMVIEFR